MKSTCTSLGAVLAGLCLLAGSSLVAAAPTTAPTTAPAPPGLEYIDTSFENASPLWYDFQADGTIQIHQIYDQERGSPNRAAGHFHFMLQGKPGSKFTLEFRNIEDVYNGKLSSISKEVKALVVSEDGRHWRSLATQGTADKRVLITLEMPGPRLFVARAEPYRVSDLDRLLKEIGGNPLVQITSIGKTVEGRELEIVRVGDEHAPYRVFVRARAHSWEPAGNWIVQGMIRRLLKKDADSERWLKEYCVWILPMANKDGVARGRSRFNVNGVDLNRHWDKPADPQLAPENAALEQWLEGQIQRGLKPHLALELHNDGHGNLHIKAPATLSAEATKRYVERMTVLEDLLKKKTWFTEGASHATPPVAMTLAEGFLTRYQIDGAVHEFNCFWIAGLNDFANGAHWETYGAELCDVFSGYFAQVKP